MDKTVKYYSVLMTRKNNEFYKKYKLPAGYKIRAYEEGMEEAWANIEFAAGEFESNDDALARFKSEFIDSGEDLSKHCFFIEAPNGEVIGTTSLWFGKHFDYIKYRIHWVAIHPDYQGKGLAKCLISYVLNLDVLKSERYVYLTTQTWSYNAIAMYLKFGFKPHCGDKPDNWDCCHSDFENYNNEAWEIIWSKIRRD